LFTGGLGAHYGAERLGCTVVPVSGGGTERQVTLMQDFGAAVLCATPSYALNIAEVAAQMGVDIATLPLRTGVFGAEPWSDRCGAISKPASASRRSTSTACRNPRPGVASECHVAQNGLACWEDHFLFEIIDPETLAPLPIGEVGELVIHHAHQGSAADGALPHPRHHAALQRTVRVRAHPCAHHAGHRPRRRHADHPRRECLSVTGRGPCWSGLRGSRRITRSCSPATGRSTP